MCKYLFVFFLRKYAFIAIYYRNDIPMISYEDEDTTARALCASLAMWLPWAV